MPPQLPSCLDSDFRGLIVTRVVTDSPADQAGVQVGDVLAAVSATMGNAVWPTSSVTAVLSALSSRKLTSGSAILELRRMPSTTTTTVNGAAAAAAVIGTAGDAKDTAAKNSAAASLSADSPQLQQYERVDSHSSSGLSHR